MFIPYTLTLLHAGFYKINLKERIVDKADLQVMQSLVCFPLAYRLEFQPGET